MNIKCRRACPRDAEKLEPVMLVISDHHGQRAKVEKLIAHIAADPQKYLLVAEDLETGQLVGSLYAIAFEDICEDCRPILLVENVAVLESAQGRGVGRLMFQEIERWAAEEMNCHYEILCSGLTRTGAHKFYKTLNFEEVKGFKKHL